MYFSWWLIGGVACLWVALHFWRKRVKAFHARQDELFQISESRIQAIEAYRVCEFYYGRKQPRAMDNQPEIDTALYDIPAFLRKDSPIQESMMDSFSAK